MKAVKCSNCCHEAEALEGGGLCGWCREGTMRVIGETPNFDPYGLLKRIKDKEDEQL